MAVFGSRAGSTIGTHRTRGFTLLEVMIVVVIVAILAAIALPNYSDYIKRGKIIEATTGLSDMRTRLEQYFLDNRKYDNAGACGVDPAVAEANIRNGYWIRVHDRSVQRQGEPRAVGLEWQR
jgi:prepilin-type N-terminal cleavage/methylation domain-containing protein